MSVNAAEIRYEIAEAIGFLANCRRVSDDGGSADLSPVPPRVEAICKSIRLLPFDEARALTGLLGKLLDDLDQTRFALARRHQRAAGAQWRASLGGPMP